MMLKSKQLHRKAKGGDEAMAQFQRTNCQGCHYAQARKVGTCKPCCDYPSCLQFEGSRCLSRRPA